VAGGLLLGLPPAGAPWLDDSRRGSLRIEDREGRLLRDVPIGGERSTWIALDELPPWVPAAFVAAEDRRFAHHPGVDPLALLRAAWLNRRAGRVVSGGSTITMQLARLLAGPAPRTPASKLTEVLDALRLELRLSKRDILEQYLNRVALGRGAVGVEAAARQWFGRSARTLSPAEATWLAVLPRAPSRLGRPDQRASLESRRLELVAHLAAAGALDSTLAARALSAPPVPIDRREAPFLAPHWTTWLLEEAAPEWRHRPGTLRTTLDLELQEEIEARLRARRDRLAERGATQAAVVVQRNDTGEVFALVGSAGFDESGAGQVNGALALRQAGSTLKPFTVALAFQSGETPASIVRDEPTVFPAEGGPFRPRNYGGEFFGPVTLRTALGSSLNMPAVRLLERLGVDRLRSLLSALGLGGDAMTDAGLGLTLGAAEVRLVDLVNAYAALGRGGVYRSRVLLTGRRDGTGRPAPLTPPPAGVRLLDPVAAWWVTDILADDDARRLTFGPGGVLDMPWPVASKTGTSSDWRDNWAIGTTREWTVGVWVGDFGGRPMQRVSGVYGAAPLLREVFGLLADRGPLTAPAPPPNLVATRYCRLSGGTAASECPSGPVEWTPPSRRGRSCPDHESSVATRSPGGRLTVACPTEGDVYFLDPALPAGSEVLELSAMAGGEGMLEWRLDGRLLARTSTPGRIGWPLAPGDHRLEVWAGDEVVVRRFRVVGVGRTFDAPGPGGAPRTSSATGK
jgi:penicillin-binding protein 1C